MPTQYLREVSLQHSAIQIQRQAMLHVLIRGSVSQAPSAQRWRPVLRRLPAAQWRSTGISTGSSPPRSSRATDRVFFGSLGKQMRKRRILPLLGPMCPSEAFGHAAFMLAGTAFLEPDILYLRAISIAAGGATLVFTYFHPTGRPLWLPFGWNVVFMLINGTQIYRILHDSSEAKKLPPQALELWRRVFAVHGLSDVEFSKLLAAGTWTTFRKATTLQEEGQPSNSVFLIVHGGADVLMHGEKAHIHIPTLS